MWYLQAPPTVATVTVYVVVVADLSTTIIFEEDCMATRVPSSETPRTRPKYSPELDPVYVAEAVEGQFPLESFSNMLTSPVELLSYVTATNPLFEITDPPGSWKVATG
jgi:hypothetical protein